MQDADMESIWGLVMIGVIWLLLRYRKRWASLTMFEIFAAIGLGIYAGRGLFVWHLGPSKALEWFAKAIESGWANAFAGSVVIIAPIIAALLAYDCVRNRQ